jgi:hypothetical protein
MTYSPSNPPSILSQTNTGSYKQWIYQSTDDFNTVAASGYFTDGYDRGLRKGDQIIVVDTNANPIVSQNYIVLSSAENEPITIQEDTLGLKRFILENITINVPADYATPVAAMNYLMDQFLAPDVTVTINVAAGTYTHSTPFPAHFQSNQIVIVGATPTLPVNSDYVITGNGVGQRATDNTNHLAMLQAKYPTKIYCDNTQFIDSRYGHGVPTIRNMLFYTSNTPDVGAYIYDCIARLESVAIHGWGGLGLALTNCGHVRTGHLSITGCGNNGMQASDCAEFKSVDSFFACSNSSSASFLKYSAAFL